MKLPTKRALKTSLTSAALAAVAVTTTMPALAADTATNTVAAPTPVAAQQTVAAPVTSDQPATAQSAGTADQPVETAQNSTNPFRDVPPNSWAYQAVQQLHADGLIQGYPDGYFKGNRPLTRYEIAVLTQRALEYTERQLADVSQATKVNANDIAALRRLVDEYGNDIKGLQTDVAALKTQVAANTAQLQRMQVHFTYYLRPGTYNDQVSAYTGAGVPLQAGSRFVAGNSYGNGQQDYTSGNYTRGVGYQIVRLAISGQVDPHVSYTFRLEDKYAFDGAAAFGFGQSSVTPNLTTGGAPNVATTATGSGTTATNTTGAPPFSYPNNTTMRLNLAFVGYNDPSGFNATVGRFASQGGPLGLLWSDYFNGVQLGYAKGPFNIFGAYSFNESALSNLSGGSTTPGSTCSTTTVVSAGGSYSSGGGTCFSSQTLYGHLDLQATKFANVGFNYITDYNYYGGQSYYRPTTGAYTNFDPLQTFGSIDFAFKFPLFSLALEGSHRFGNNPITGDAWNGSDGFWGYATLGKTAPVIGNNYLEAGYVNAGVNGIAPHSEVTGTLDYQQFDINDPAGYHILYAGIHHWFGAGARIGLVYQRYQLNSGVNIPFTAYDLPGLSAAGLPVAGAGCSVAAPCTVRSDLGQEIWLQTVLSF